MADYGTEYTEKPKKPKKSDEDEQIDNALEEVEEGKMKPANLAQARKTLPGTKLSRPRLGGFGVGRY